MGAISYVGGYWFKLNALMAIILGAVMGLIRYGAEGRTSNNVKVIKILK